MNHADPREMYLNHVGYTIGIATLDPRTAREVDRGGTEQHDMRLEMFRGSSRAHSFMLKSFFMGMNHGWSIRALEIQGIREISGASRDPPSPVYPWMRGHFSVWLQGKAETTKGVRSACWGIWLLLCTTCHLRRMTLMSTSRGFCGRRRLLRRRLRHPLWGLLFALPHLCIVLTLRFFGTSFVRPFNCSLVRQ